MNQTLVIAISILLGSVIIAGAVVLKEPTKTSESISAPSAATTMQDKINNFTPEQIMRKEGRLLYGNKDATITIVEFSDLECPFCARLDPVLRQIIDDSDGKIVWEYRHLPLSIHPNAQNAAIISECAARELGGEAFWDFAEIALSNSLNPSFLQKTAYDLGMTENSLQNCLDKGDAEAVVNADMTVAANLGIGGTPFSVIIDSQGKMTAVEGAQPDTYWRNILKNIK